MADNRDLWPQLRELVGLGDRPEEAADYLSQDAVNRFNEAAQNLVTRLVETSTAYADMLEKIVSLREAISMAYDYLLTKRYADATNELRKVVLQ